jgi:putative colanic acid biosynthesis acetyltransferase WcaF
MEYQDLGVFSLPPGFRGRPAWLVQTWWLVEGILFRLSPQVMYRWRASLLRLFGAKIGDDVLIRPTVRVTYPWKVTIGDRCWIGDDVVLYSLGEICIGADSVISQKSYLCTGTHDYTDTSFRISATPVRIGSEVWIASDVFIAPGVTVGDGAVVGARSTVLTDLPGGVVSYGQPAKPVKSRL